MTPLPITAYTAVSALGRGREETYRALCAGRSGLRPNDFQVAAGIDLLDCFIGRVEGLEQVCVPSEYAAYDCRNNRLALMAMEQDGFMAQVEDAKRRYGSDRVAVLLGTSTSGIFSTEQAYRERDPASGALPADTSYATVHNFGSLTQFVASVLQLGGPTLAISTACSSSAKVFASAARMIDAGLCDAAVVGGVDTLCATTLFGFNSLQLVSSEPCKPFDIERNGVSLGEAAAFALIERSEQQAPVTHSRLALLGYGESADAHHMSSPHPEGLGAQLAMRAALARAAKHSAKTQKRIAFVNAHGTATRNNDAIESHAIAAVLGPETRVTSIKGATGHSLGAAGALGAVVSLLAIERGLIPGTANTRRIDPQCEAAIQIEPLERTVDAVLSNSFGFGGNNASLVFGRTGARGSIDGNEVSP